MVLAAPLEELARAPLVAGRAGLTLEEIERRGILDVLQETNWRVGGPTGAARRLGIPRTTLIYKMRRLGIARGRA